MSARLTASKPVILLGIQMEKKIALRFPSRMRGMSMLPFALRGPRSNLPSRKRCVVSSCVSTTIVEKCSFLARAEISSAVTPAARKAPAEMQSPAVRIVRDISIFISPLCISDFLMRLQFPADLLGLLHHAQGVAAKDFANVIVGVALPHQRCGDFRKFRTILHAVWHVRAIEIGAQAHM